ncbi:hypothetical protein AVO45_10555 [Ruegeria marisrubri]|uniref:Uncharacterized protein n=1 Tax=Ruegeria marisrubri TaxID=1685379 RepID=A0A0X3TMD1_9RHOB|nr:hypothetical protein [Ruegeria marisrubri]KUJ76922.1 hypothetical protein AVO45_10555 [Ruegeria marisrubri]
MRLNKNLAALAVAAMAGAASADPVDWKSVGGWDVSFYPNSEGCQAFALFEEDTAFFIGFDSTFNELSLEVTLMDERWGSIEAGKEYQIGVKFGDETPWSLGMEGLQTDGFPGLRLMIDAGTDEADLFVKEFQRETSMTWNYGDAVLGRYTLRGSRRAFDEVVNCQLSYLEAKSSQSDPFAASNSDPFSD